jgi:hypothetical protein
MACRPCRAACRQSGDMTGVDGRNRITTHDELEVLGEREADYRKHALERVFRVVDPIPGPGSPGQPLGKPKICGGGGADLRRKKVGAIEIHPVLQVWDGFEERGRER